jgi:anti-sigma regulatory factor (Ser/Thr protein kinase)
VAEPHQVVCAVHEESQVGATRRQAQQIAERTSLDETERGRLAIIVTELANNVLRHGGGGDVILREANGTPPDGVEVVAVDHGRGISDIEQALRDGHSTAGTSGTGLGSVRRLANEFDIFSEVGRGTAVYASVRGRSAPPAGWWRYGAVETCAPRETVCGDTHRVLKRGVGFALMVADGLGHGPLAAEAATAAALALEEQPWSGASDYLTRAHDRLRGTRGAAVAVAVCETMGGSIVYAGIGNIAGTIVSPDGAGRGLVAFNGTVGGEMHTAREQTYDWRVGDLLIMHSDGLQTRWTLRDRPGLAARHPAIIAAILHRDHRRTRDDSTVVVLERTA